MYGLFAVLAVAQPQPPVDVCRTAMEEFHQRNWSAAADGFAACEERDPGKTDALLLRGKALVNLQEFDHASAALRSYAGQHPQSDDAAYLLAFIAFREDKPKESLQLFSEAAKLKPPTANDLMIIALNYVLLGDYNDAAGYLESSLRKDPDSTEARYHLGRVRYQQNQFDLAIAAFREVIQRDPGSVKAHDNLGLSLEAKNEVDAAITAYRKAIELDAASESHSEQPYLNMGSLFEKANQIPQAIPLLTRAAEISPKDFRAHYELGKAYFDANQFDAARLQAESAVQLKPSESSGHYLLGRIYQRLGKPEAKEQFRLTSELIREKNAHAGSGMATGTASH